MFSRIAIVNRGEAAMRLIHAVRGLSAETGQPIEVIALHTDVDAAATFVREADIAYDLGPAASRPYLNMKVLERALLETGADAAWVDRFRDFGALWVNGARESERFVFYEAVTHERVALELTRGDRYRPDHRHFVLRNRGAHAVHDVFVTHRERDRVFVFFAPSIPAGRSAGFVLEAHAVTDVLPWSAGSAADFVAATRARLRERLVDADEPTPPTSMQWSRDDCVMMRDPAIPTTTAEGHRLYAHEVDAILDVWAGTFFGSPGTTIVYREDPAYLDRAMPLSIYTDMYNHVKLRRLGLAVWRLWRLFVSTAHHFV